MKRLVILCVCALLAASCVREHTVFREMNKVESYVHEAPDSALAVLAGLDTAGISSPRMDARYTLLNSIARYRLYIDEDDDTALVRAADYFRSHHDEKRLMRTLFLAGYIQFNQADYKRAILSLTEAESLSDELEDHFYGGLICRQMALVFERTFNNVERLESIQKSYRLFAEGHCDPHDRYTLLMVGKAFSGNEMFEKSESTYMKVLQIAKMRKDTLLCSNALLSYSEDLIIRDDKQPGKALEMIMYVKDSLRKVLPCYSWVNAGYAAALMKNETLSKTFFQNAEKLAVTEYDKYLIAFRKYNSAVALNESTLALESTKSFVSYLQQFQVALERESAISNQRNFYYERQQLEKAQNTVTRQRLAMIVLLLCLLTVFSVWTIRRLFLRKRCLQREKDFYAGKVQNMEETYSRALKVSLQSGMRFFNRLAEFKWTNQSERILPNFEAMLNNLATDSQTIKEMMATLNETRNNLMVRIEKQVPTLKKDDLMIYCYLAHRFDHTTLCTILNRTPGALNAKIYRIREKIEKSGAPDMEEFLDSISN